MASDGCVGTVEDANFEKFCLWIEEKVGLLSSEDRNVRRKALESILKRYQTSSESERNAIARDTVWKPIVSSMFDRVERLRELSLTVLHHFVLDFQSIEDLAVYLIPAIVQRLSSNVEPSEEIRLSLVTLTRCVIGKSPRAMDSHLKSVSQALAVAISDVYPEVKKEGCACVTTLANTFPQQFHSCTDVLVEPLLQALVHQHSRVRVAAITALGYVIMHGGGEFLVSTFSALAQRLLDPVPQVRLTVTKVVGDCLQNFPDRHSNFPRLIPLLLISIADEISEISTVANDLWHVAGHQYERENENDLQDIMNFEKPTMADFPSKLPRFPVGCRILVTRNLVHLLTAVFNDLKDWQEPVRLKASQLLYLLLLNSEEGMIQHFPKIIDGLITGCRDDAPKIVLEVMKSTELVGYFVPSDLWCSSILEKIDDGASVEKLRVLDGLLRGSRILDTEQHVKAIASSLVDAIVQHGHNVDVRKQILACLESLLRGECKVAGFELFRVSMSLLALEDEGQLQHEILRLLEKLADVIGVKSENELCDLLAKDLIQILKGEMYDLWTSESTEWLIFATLLLRSGAGLSDVLDEILPILTVVTKPEKEHTLKFYCFRVLSHLFENVLGPSTGSTEFTLAVIRDCVLPNLAWHPGKTAVVLRSAAISCLRIILETSQLDEDKFVAVFESLLSRLAGSLRDELHTTRMVACQIFDLIFEKHWRLFKDHHQFCSITEELLQRMEDVNNAVRVRACCAIGSCVTACRLSKTFDEQELHAHFVKMVRGLLIYLDDEDVEVQKATLGVLKIFSECSPNLTRSEVEKVQEKFRNQNHLSELLHSIEELTIH